MLLLACKVSAVYCYSIEPHHLMQFTVILRTLDGWRSYSSAEM